MKQEKKGWSRVGRKEWKEEKRQVKKNKVFQSSWSCRKLLNGIICKECFHSPPRCNAFVACWWLSYLEYSITWKIKLLNSILCRWHIRNYLLWLTWGVYLCKMFPPPSFILKLAQSVTSDPISLDSHQMKLWSTHHPGECRRWLLSPLHSPTLIRSGRTVLWLNS